MPWDGQWALAFGRVQEVCFLFLEGVLLDVYGGMLGALSGGSYYVKKIVFYGVCFRCGKD